MFSQKAFADYFKINYPLLSGGRDVTAIHKVLKDYGVFDEPRLTAKRAYIIIDRQGVVRYVKVMDNPLDLLQPDDLLKALKESGAS